MRKYDPLKKSVARFLDAWLGARQMIQAANFNRFQSAGLSATQFMTLNLIPVRGEAMTLSQLAQRMNLGTATVARTIDSLESRGLLTRTRSDVDRRQVLLALTTAGNALQNAASAEFHGHMSSLFRKMKPERRRGLVEGLEALLHAGDTSRGDDGDENADFRSAGGAAPAKRNSPKYPKR